MSCEHDYNEDDDDEHDYNDDDDDNNEDDADRVEDKGKSEAEDDPGEESGEDELISGNGKSFKWQFAFKWNRILLWALHASLTLPFVWPMHVSRMHVKAEF